MNIIRYLVFSLIFFGNIFAADNQILDTLPLFSVIPFVGILLSIAILPLINLHFWELNFGKISAFWAFLFLIPFTYNFGLSIAMHQLVHVLLLEYVPFIIILLALFTISGGIQVSGTLSGTPYLNVAILTLGTLIASWMGTTGAAMLLIRPLIRANLWRRKKTHIFVFFIFLVANVGGSLTPLGDPPLFLGFLNGVSFFWTTKHMFLPMILVSLILIIVFYFLDEYFFRKEDRRAGSRDKIKPKPEDKLKLKGKVNFLFILGVIVSVLISGVWDPKIELSIFHVPVSLQNIARDIILLLLTYLSLKFTDHAIRDANRFTWFPIKEVAKLFLGIFITIIPAIAILKAGSDGALSFVINLTQDMNGEPRNIVYFWLTGILSSLLDNAPTYLVFFNTAGGDALILMSDYSQTLLAISAGAVFFGAFTYIGNAPNFMVRSIVEENQIKMPSFFGYIIWSIVILFPIFILVSFIFFRV